MKNDPSMIYERNSTVLDQQLSQIHSEIKARVFDYEDSLGYECLGSGIVDREVELIIMVPRGKKLPEMLLKLFDLKFDFLYNTEVIKWKSIDEIAQETYKMRVKFIC